MTGRHAASQAAKPSKGQATKLPLWTAIPRLRKYGSSHSGPLLLSCPARLQWSIKSRNESGRQKWDYVPDADIEQRPPFSGPEVRLTVQHYIKNTKTTQTMPPTTTTNTMEDGWGTIRRSMKTQQSQQALATYALGAQPGESGSSSKGKLSTLGFGLSVRGLRRVQTFCWSFHSSGIVIKPPKRLFKKTPAS